ncbi:DUF6979 family protein [Neisseria sp. S1]|uniref:DUF6979 family protein n=1 Tax=Neisseria sp. S1 TaxID=3318354 RepID=UPI003A85C78A
MNGTKINLYGKIALEAVELIISDGKSCEEAWANAAKYFSDKGTMQKKSCPKHAFFGLCKTGLIKGIKGEPEAQLESINSSYAIKAVKLLKQNPNLVGNKKALWDQSVGEAKEENEQMDVVLALWVNDLIEK